MDRFGALPPDLQHYILQHRDATTLQSKVRQYQATKARPRVDFTVWVEIQNRKVKPSAINSRNSTPVTLTNILSSAEFVLNVVDGHSVEYVLVEHGVEHGPANFEVVYVYDTPRRLRLSDVVDVLYKVKQQCFVNAPDTYVRWLGENNEVFATVSLRGV